jgi:hypothetical protein
VSNLAGRNACEAGAGLESEVVDADPSDERGKLYGQGRNPARERAIAATNKHLYRSTGVVSTACQEGDLQRVGEARDGRRSRLRTSLERAAASLGVGEGHTTDEAG